jgi:hypothetical protein
VALPARASEDLVHAMQIILECNNEIPFDMAA